MAYTIGLLLRLAWLSCDHGDFLAARSIMVEDFRSNKHNPELCDFLADFDPFRQWRVPAANAFIEPKVVAGRTFTLVLPYHPSLAAVGITRIINDLVADWMPCLIHLTGPIKMRLAWCLRGSPLYVTLRNQRS